MKTETTTCCCRHCGKPMASFVQPLAPFQVQRGRRAQTYVTCEEKGCRLEGFTFEKETYATRDLAAYLETKV